jgi:hypothetical protein
MTQSSENPIFPSWSGVWGTINASLLFSGGGGGGGCGRKHWLKRQKTKDMNGIIHKQQLGDNI